MVVVMVMLGGRSGEVRVLTEAAVGTLQSRAVAEGTAGEATEIKNALKYFFNELDHPPVS